MSASDTHLSTSDSRSSTSTQAMIMSSKSLLRLLPDDIVIYHLFPLLGDGDAIDCFETCKYLYYTYTWHYRIKNEINLSTLYTRPAFRCAVSKNPLLPRPIIVRGVILGDEDFAKIAEMLLSNDGNGEAPVKEKKENEEGSEESDALKPQKHKIWGEVVERFCDDTLDVYEAIENYNFQIFPHAEFESLEELELTLSCRLLTMPFWPPNLKTLRYHCMYEWTLVLETGIFPPTLKYLEIFMDGPSGDIFLEPGAFPEGLKSVTIVDGSLLLTDPFSMNTYPSSLEHLFIDMIAADVDPQHLPRYIPSMLKSLKLTHFSFPLTGLLPSTLIELTLASCNLTLSVDDLPTGLKRLKIEEDYLTGVLVTLVPGLLPLSLQYANFEKITNTVLGPNILPEGLLEFSIEKDDIEFEVGSLPSSLQVLGLPQRFYRSLSTLRDTFATLPNLYKLVIQDLHLSNELSNVTIPSSVKVIKVENCYVDILQDYQGISSLTIDRLELLQISRSQNMPFHVDTIPKSLKELHIENFDDRSNPPFLPGSLPDSLEMLELNDYRHPLGPGVLPSSLRSLTLRYDYKCALNELPPKLQYLNLNAQPWDYIYSLREKQQPRPPFVRISESKMPAHLQIHLIPQQNKGYPFRRYQYIEPEIHQGSNPHLESKKRKASEEVMAISKKR